MVLPSLDGRGSIAYDVDTAGVVVGAAEVAGGYWHAVRWVDGRIEDLGTLGDPTARPRRSTTGAASWAPPRRPTAAATPLPGWTGRSRISA
ncbi:hypothetical protein [Micromonospora marina]|uniref:hypothetical protein n=1 Tax=Micromonospora marina TaxID=307120 RepID=UPI003453C6AE